MALSTRKPIWRYVIPMLGALLLLLSFLAGSVSVTASPTGQAPTPIPEPTPRPTRTILLTDPVPDPKQEGVRWFSQTGHTLREPFLSYWNKHGELEQFGYPLTEEFYEPVGVDNRQYLVQYFERAIFELHPENQPPYDVLLSHLGTFRYRYKTNMQGANDCRRVYSSNNRIIGQGSVAEPTQRYRLTGYRVEEVALPGIIICSVYTPNSEGRFQTQTLSFDKAWRFIVTGERVSNIGDGWYLFLNGKIVSGAGGGNELVFIIYDGSILKEGSSIGVSYSLKIVPDETLPVTVRFSGDSK